MRFSWLAVSGPGVSRMCTWTGKTKRVWITGLDREFVDNMPLSVDLPQSAVLHATRPDGECYEFIVFDR